MADYQIKKLTRFKWLNLFELTYRLAEKTAVWLVCSRKDRPVADAEQPDAVFIIPILKTPLGNRLVVIREFRPAIWDWEYAFPAGLIDDKENPETAIQREIKEETGLEVKRIIYISNPVYSSAGMSDESCLMALVEVDGQPCSAGCQDHEQIETILMDISDIRQLLLSKNKIAGKAWGILYHFAALGRIEFCQDLFKGK